MDEYQKEDKAVRQYIIDTVRDFKNIEHDILVEKVFETIKKEWVKTSSSDSCFSHKSIHDDIVCNIQMLILEKKIEFCVDLEFEKDKEFDEGRYGKQYYVLPLKYQSKPKS